MTEDERKNGNSMYVACNVKNLRIDEFHSLKFDSIKPKLFENERPGIFDSFCFFVKNLFLFLDEFNDENVPPINIRIDFPKSESSSLPTVTVQLEDRTLAIASHSIDVLLQNLEEIHTGEEKSIQKTHPHKFLPIDVHLNNVQLSLEVY
jgi:hypothetical protein